MDKTPEVAGAGSGIGDAGVRVVVLSLPEDEGEGLGFRLTRTLWDPYPWVREVAAGSRAAAAGLRAGDCLLQACGQDLLGLPVGQVAGLIRGDGAGGAVSLVVWSCGVDPTDDPELLWSGGGGGARGERARRALAGAVRALACCVCAATAARPLACARSHLYCEPCWVRLQRCALCRETLPPKESPYAKNMVAEQVFEAIASEYEIKDSFRKPLTSSNSPSPALSPALSPAASPAARRRGLYQISMMNRKKAVQFRNKFGQNYASDPNIHRSTHTDTTNQSTNSVQNSVTGNTENTCNCQTASARMNANDPNGSKIKIEIDDAESKVASTAACCRSAGSPSCLQASAPPRAPSPSCLQAAAGHLSRSLNSIHVAASCCPSHHLQISTENMKAHSCCNISAAATPVVLLAVSPTCALSCDQRAC